MALRRLQNGRKELAIGSDVSFKKGEIILEAGDACGVLDMVVQVTVRATVLDAGGLSTTERDAILTSLQFYMAVNGSDGRRVEPFQNVAFTDMRRAAQAQLHEDMGGYSDTSEGLAKALAAGDNVLTFRMPVSTGYYAAIKESEVFGGMGPSQAKTVEITVKQLGEPLAEIDSNLELRGPVIIDFEPNVDKVAGDQWSMLALWRKLSEAKKDRVKTLDGTLLFADDVTDTLASTDLERITVRVGDATVTKDATPAQIVRDYEREEGSSAVSTAYKTSQTPVFRQKTRPLVAIVTGPAEFVQEDHVQDWDLRHGLLPAHSEVEMRAFAEAVAAQLQDGESIAAINTLMLEELKFTHNHLHLGSFRCFRKGERQYDLYPQLRVEKNGDGKARVFVPEHVLAEKAPAWFRARRAKQTELADSIVRSVVAWIPGGAPSGRGFRGNQSQAVSDVVSYFTRYLTAMARQAATAGAKK